MIRYACSCGAQYLLEDALAKKIVECFQCGQTGLVKTNFWKNKKWLQKAGWVCLALAIALFVFLYLGKIGKHKIELNQSIQMPTDVDRADNGPASFIGSKYHRSAEPGLLDFPLCAVPDSNGNIYVADSGNNRIQKFDSTGKLLTFWNAAGDFKPLFRVAGLALSAENKIYAIDAWNRIVQFDEFGACIKEWSSNQPGLLKNPVALSRDSQGSLYILDQSKGALLKFDAQLNLLDTWDKFDLKAIAEDSPHGLAISREDSVFILDAGSGRVRRFNVNGVWQESVRLERPADYACAPCALLIDTNAQWLIADNFLGLNLYNPQGQWIARWGADGLGNGQAVKIRSLARDAQGNILLTDSALHQIIKLSAKQLSEQLVGNSR